MPRYVNKMVRSEHYKNLITGLSKRFRAKDVFLLAGGSRTRDELQQILGDHVALMDRSDSARAAWLQAVQNERTHAAEHRETVAALVAYLRVIYGNDAKALGSRPRRRRR
jgi:hypothetical protein